MTPEDQAPGPEERPPSLSETRPSSSRPSDRTPLPPSHDERETLRDSSGPAAPEEPLFDATAPQSGQWLVDRYRLTQRLGKGGMGVVWRAWDHELERDVAIKLLPPEIANDARAQRQLKLEAQAAITLAHPHIVKLLGFRRSGATQFLEMEYVDGPSLADVLHERGPLPETEVQRYLLDICAGLSEAHRRGVIHRDIKPANLLLAPDGTIKIADFGIARIVAESTTRATGQATSGTLLYMSPEQLRGRACDARSDLYSLGVTAYELLCGEVPYPSGDITYQHLHERPEPIFKTAPVLWPVIERMLEKEPEDRFQDAWSLAEVLGGGGTGPRVAYASHPSDPARAGDKTVLTDPTRRAAALSRPDRSNAQTIGMDPDAATPVARTPRGPAAGARRTPWLWAALGLVLAAGLGVGGLQYMRYRERAATTGTGSALSPLAQGLVIATQVREDAGEFEVAQAIYAAQLAKDAATAANAPELAPDEWNDAERAWGLAEVVDARGYAPGAEAQYRLAAQKFTAAIEAITALQDEQQQAEAAAAAEAAKTAEAERERQAQLAQVETIRSGTTEAHAAAVAAKAAEVVPLLWKAAEAQAKEAEAALAGQEFAGAEQLFAAAQEAYAAAQAQAVALSQARAAQGTARQSAEQAEAATYAAGEWGLAEQTVAGVTALLERGAYEDAQHAYDKASAHYTAAVEQAGAIQAAAGSMAKARATLDNARKTAVKAESATYAPAAWAQGEQAIAGIEALLQRKAYAEAEAAYKTAAAHFQTAAKQAGPVAVAAATMAKTRDRLATARQKAQAAGGQQHAATEWQAAEEAEKTAHKLAAFADANKSLDTYTKADEAYAIAQEKFSNVAQAATLHATYAKEIEAARQAIQNRDAARAQQHLQAAARAGGDTAEVRDLQSKATAVNTTSEAYDRELDRAQTALNRWDPDGALKAAEAAQQAGGDTAAVRALRQQAEGLKSREADYKRELDRAITAVSDEKPQQALTALDAAAQAWGETPDVRDLRRMAHNIHPAGSGAAPPPSQSTAPPPPQSPSQSTEPSPPSHKQRKKSRFDYMGDR